MSDNQYVVGKDIDFEYSGGPPSPPEPVHGDGGAASSGAKKKRKKKKKKTTAGHVEIHSDGQGMTIDLSDRRGKAPAPEMPGMARPANPAAAADYAGMYAGGGPEMAEAARIARQNMSLLSAPLFNGAAEDSPTAVAQNLAGTLGAALSAPLWESTQPDEREKIRDFWVNLNEAERMDLVKLDKEVLLRKVRRERQSCNCSGCAKKRLAVETELETLYDAYYGELEASSHKLMEDVDVSWTTPEPSPAPQASGAAPQTSAVPPQSRARLLASKQKPAAPAASHPAAQPAAQLAAPTAAPSAAPTTAQSAARNLQPFTKAIARPSITRTQAENAAMLSQELSDQLGQHIDRAHNNMTDEELRDHMLKFNELGDELTMQMAHEVGMTPEEIQEQIRLAKEPGAIERALAETPVPFPDHLLGRMAARPALAGKSSKSRKLEETDLLPGLLTMADDLLQNDGRSIVDVMQEFYDRLPSDQLRELPPQQRVQEQIQARAAAPAAPPAAPIAAPPAAPPAAGSSASSPELPLELPEELDEPAQPFARYDQAKADVAIDEEALNEWLERAQTMSAAPSLASVNDTVSAMRNAMDRPAVVRKLRDALAKEMEGHDRDGLPITAAARLSSFSRSDLSYPYDKNPPFDGLRAAPSPPPASSIPHAAGHNHATHNCNDHDEQHAHEGHDEYDDVRVSEGRRMLKMLAARMFEQRVINAYREHIARERQLQLLAELEEEENKAKQGREAKKSRDKEKRKDKRRAIKEHREQERLKKEEEQRLKEEAARKKAEQLQQHQREQERLKQEARRLDIEERLKRMAEEEREREALERATSRAEAAEAEAQAEAARAKAAAAAKAAEAKAKLDAELRAKADAKAEAKLKADAKAKAETDAKAKAKAAEAKAAEAKAAEAKAAEAKVKAERAAERAAKAAAARAAKIEAKAEARAEAGSTDALRLSQRDRLEREHSDRLVEHVRTNLEALSPLGRAMPFGAQAQSALQQAQQQAQQAQQPQQPQQQPQQQADDERYWGGEWNPRVGFGLQSASPSPAQSRSTSVSNGWGGPWGRGASPMASSSPIVPSPVIANRRTPSSLGMAPHSHLGSQQPQQPQQQQQQQQQPLGGLWFNTPHSSAGGSTAPGSTGSPHTSFASTNSVCAGMGAHGAIGPLGAPAAQSQSIWPQPVWGASAATPATSLAAVQQAAMACYERLVAEGDAVDGYVPSQVLFHATADSLGGVSLSQNDLFRACGVIGGGQPVFDCLRDSVGLVTHLRLVS